MGPGVDLDDVQGLVRYAYKRHTEACFLLMRVRDRDAACAFLASASVGNAVDANPPPATVLQVAVTSEGLRALGVAADLVDGYATEFVAGMADPNRALRLGDVGDNAPELWQWGTGERLPHVALLLYALPGKLADFRQSVKADAATGFEVITTLATADMHGSEPFGFVDGISQPEVDWARQRPARDFERAEYANLTCLGEFVLGYPNEYGRYTDRPLLDPQRDPDAILPRAEEAPDRADLGRSGSYLVLRQLRQDVHGFWRYLDREAAGDPTLRTRWAEAMVGRTLAGESLVAESRGAPPTAGTPPPDVVNAFTYGADPRGQRCPLGAHIRRANPRTADLPPGGPGLLSWLARTLGFNATALAADHVASTRFHRMLRRGREYGPAVPLAEALQAPAATSDTGLQFLCLNASISRQFEFVQSAWLMNQKFDGLDAERDPLLGHRLADASGRPADGYSMPRPGRACERLRALPQFVTVLGGAYFLLPGRRALRYLASPAARRPP